MHNVTDRQTDDGFMQHCNINARGVG